MQLKTFKRAPVLIGCAVIVFVSLVRLLQPSPVERIEWMTYDMRARAALKMHATVATNLGFVFIDEKSVQAVWNGSLGFKFGLYWPRQVYGRLVDELAAQGAKAVAFDIIMGELRPDHALVQMGNGSFVPSDEFFAMQMRRASNVVIAVTKEVTPPRLFLTNALAAGDITTEKDADGILRRVQVFRQYTNWHPVFLQAAAEFGVDLDRARFANRTLLLPTKSGEEVKVPIDSDGNFDLADFVGEKIPQGMARRSPPFNVEKAWHMGVVLAAIDLHLDLDHAMIDLSEGKIVLQGPGIERVIPVDRDGYFYVDWSLPFDDPRLTREAIQDLLAQNKARLEGATNALTERWREKLAVVGSSAVIGNNLTDRGATPISKDTLLVSKHWNVANSIILNRFVQRTSAASDLILIMALGIASAFLTLQFRVLIGSAFVACLALIYVVFAFALYASTRVWVPVVIPVTGAVLMNYVFLLAWRVIFEQANTRRIKAIFGSVVSEKIMNELLATENLSLGGARREITVLFADVRGFTELTDKSQDQVDELVRRKNLTGDAAELARDEQARETLQTVNLYLGLVADTIIKQDATLDKFIGDCVMAFWGAPTPQPKHALQCVRAAIEAQRAIETLNQTRAEENRAREIENQARAAAGLDPKPMLPLLLLGSGINTGMATAGMMGSVEKTKNYTVFGRDVNLASRLEGLSGRGRIFISETTYEHLLRDDPELAGACVAQEPQKVKGIANLVKVYEVPWRGDKPTHDNEAREIPSSVPVTT